jgi:hypothetical protein
MRMRSTFTGLLPALLVATLAGCGSEAPNDPDDPAGWSAPQVLASPAAARATRVAVSPSGEATAVWIQPGSPAAVLSASRFEPARGWGAPQPIATPGNVAFDVAGDASGNVLVAWVQAADGLVTVFARRFAPATGWGPAQSLRAGGAQPFDLLASRPSLASAPDGRAVVAWRQIAGGEVEIRAARFTPGAGWQVPVLVAATSGNASPVAVGIDPGGNALAAWLALDGGVTRVRVSRSAPAAAWTPAETIDSRTAAGDMSQAPLVAVTPAGDAFVLYPGSSVFRSNREEVWATRFEVARGWQPPVQIASGQPGGVAHPAVAADGQGGAVAVWVDGNLTDVWANRYEPGAGWRGLARLDSGNGQPFVPAVAAGRDGAAFVVWVQGGAAGPPHRVWSNRFLPSTGWTNASILNTDEHADAPDVGVDDRGNAVAVWVQGVFQQEAPWTSRFLTAP